MDDGHAVVVTIDADISDVFFKLDWTDFDRLFFFYQIADLNAGGKMTFFYEFS